MIGDGDLESIFESGDFDEEAVFDTTGGPLTVRGWFTDPSDATTLFGQVQIEASKPSFICKTDAIATVRNRIAVTIRGTDYTVEKIEAIGIGASVVYLKT
jgi:hypothetical protein